LRVKYPREDFQGGWKTLLEAGGPGGGSPPPFAVSGGDSPRPFPLSPRPSPSACARADRGSACAAGSTWASPRPVRRRRYRRWIAPAT